MLQMTSMMIGQMPANALKIFVILMLERGPRDKKFLATATDMTDKTLAKALDQLVMMGLITHNRGHVYQIAVGVQQLPLMALEATLAYEPDEPVDNPVDKSVDNSGENVIDLPFEEPEEIKSRNNSDFLDHACMYESDSLNHDVENLACMHAESRKNSDFSLEDALLEAGFRDPGLSRLRKMPGLTARMVQYHVETAETLGLALYRIEHKFKVPANWERAGPDRSKYAGGDYADFVVT